ncbi:hypothetical protein [Nocardia brevicatena]|nr:hypothetical protein [Nocardia brevicatena]
MHEGGEVPAGVDIEHGAFACAFGLDDNLRLYVIGRHGSRSVAVA